MSLFADDEPVSTRSSSAFSPMERPAVTPAAVLELFNPANAPGGSLDEFLGLVLDRSAEWFEADGVSLFLQDERSPANYPLAAKAGLDDRIPDDAQVEQGVGIAGTCIAQKQPLLLQDPSTHPLLASKGVRRNRAVHSAMIVPLLTPENECVGVLNLSRTQKHNAFGPSDLAFASSVANQIALAVVNGRLVSRLRVAVMKTAELHLQLDTVIRTLSVGVLVLDAFGKVLHLNAEASKFFNGSIRVGDSTEQWAVSIDEPIGSRLAEVVRDALAGVKSDAVVVDSGQAWSFLASPLPGGGATLAIHDASEHERMHREINRVKRLAEIGQMTAAIAHEIRNPLTAMKAAAQVIRTAPEHAAEFGAIIEEEVDKLNALCSDFLEFARPLELHIAPFKISDLLKDLAEKHRPEFDAARVQLDVIDWSRSDLIYADRNRLEQVVRNLMLNALQATEPGGRVALFADDDRIVVQDTGTGMEQTTIEQLFTPFFTTKADGTGLGLSTARKIIDAHGGQIHVESQPGHGTRFTVELGRKAA
jgi:signal transduction histidine kinase